MVPRLSMTPWFLMVATLVVAACLPLTACGGGGGGGGGGGNPGPTLTAVAPARGPMAGGTLVTLTGTNFEASASVTVDGNPPTTVTVVNSTTITCVTPAGTAGTTVDVAVTTPNGTATLPASFTYNPQPTLTSVDPSTAFAPGGAILTLYGSGFTANSAGTNTVLVGGVPATNVVAVSDIILTCTAPAGNPGPADVQLSNANGTALLTAGLTIFTYPPSFPASAIRLNTDTAGAKAATYPEICCAGPNVYVVWQDERNGAGDIYFTRSTDGGATWLASDVRLDTDTAGIANSENANICCDGSNLYVTWEDARNGDLDIYLNRSTDGGATWLASDMRLDTDIAGAAMSSDHSSCCDGSNLYVVWMDDRSGSGDIYFTRSTDGGATWLASDVRLDTDPAGVPLPEPPQVCCDGSTCT